MLAGKKASLEAQEIRRKMRNRARARKRKKKPIFGEPAVHTRMALHDTRMDLPSTRSIRK